MTLTTAAAEAAEARLLEATQRGLLAFRQRVAAERATIPDRPPAGWTVPAYDTREFWQAVSVGWISEAEAELHGTARQERQQRARAAEGTRGQPPARWSRPEPQASRQYATSMATTAARDDRLTPQAKALLQVIRARCGNGLQTQTCKTTLASIMCRHARSIQRYLAELQMFGYIVTKIRKNAKGLYSGLYITITDAVRPFFAGWSKAGKWAFDAAGRAIQKPRRVGFPDRTKLSPKNESGKILRFPALQTPILDGS